ENLTRSAGTSANNMGAEIWSLKNPTATTANVVITYTRGGKLMFDQACARTLTGVDLPVPSSGVTFSTGHASSGINLTGLASTTDKSIFVDIAACNCGGLVLTPEPNRKLDLNAGPNQVGSSTLTKSPAGNDTMPWTTPAVEATAAGVVYPAMLT